MRYESPALTKFGTLRDITLGRKGQIGDDAIPGIGLDCDLHAPPSDPAGCPRS